MVLAIRQPKPLQHGDRLLPGNGGRDAHQVGKVEQVLQWRKPPEHITAPLQHGPNGAKRFPALLADVKSANGHSASGRLNQPQRAFERCCLAGAVRAQQANHLSRLHRKGNAINGAVMAIPFAQTLNGEYRSQADALLIFPWQPVQKGACCIVIHCDG